MGRRDRKPEVRVPSLTDPAEIAGAYWSGNVTRKELQAAMEPIAETLKALLQDIHGKPPEGKKPATDGLITMIAKLDVTIAFIMDKLGVTPEEFKAFHDRKMAEYEAYRKAAATGKPN